MEINGFDIFYWFSYVLLKMLQSDGTIPDLDIFY